MAEYAVGMVGLGVMGRNLSYNMAEKGFSVAAWDAWPDPVDRFVSDAQGLPVAGFKDIQEMVASLRRPRRIVLLVKAGAVTDKAIATLLPYLTAGDILVDGGNEHFTNTERRAAELAEKGIRYFGMGVSGGEEGARHGPSMMPGGDREAYRELEPVFTKIAAQVTDGACVTYIGPGGAGHYVKMVHNGIEYGDMQLIAEAYSVLKQIGGLSNAELAELFTEWNRTELQSFLIEITADIFRTKDPEGPGELLDAVLDAASMKGTGKWTVQDAADVGIAIPTVATSVDARVLSSDKAQREINSKTLPGPRPAPCSADQRARVIAGVRAALYASKACSYAQGMQLLRAVSEQRSWGLQLSEIARIWQGGCIIRAQFLSRIKAAFEHNPNLPNLLLDPGFVEELSSRQEGWRSTIALAAQAGLPLLTMSASLAYYDTIRTARLPANLIQAQRDLFGAHTYKRVDREGDFHSKWRLNIFPRYSPVGSTHLIKALDPRLFLFMQIVVVSIELLSSETLLNRLALPVMNAVDQALQEFKNEDYTVRLCSAIFGVLPFAPQLPHYSNLDGAIQSLYPQATSAQKARAAELANGEGVRSALWMANAIDTGDSGIAVYSGLKSAFGFFFGSGTRMDALETDPQQGTDAALKLMGLAYMINKLYPGSLSDKMQLFQTTPSGQALAIYYGAIEVALPFSDNMIQGGGDFLQRLLDRYSGDATNKLGSALGSGPVQEAQGMLHTLMTPIQGVINQVAPHAQSIANSAKQYIPGFMNAADKVAGMVATGADTLPVYRYLGARLAAETCVLIASRGG